MGHSHVPSPHHHWLRPNLWPLGPREQAALGGCLALTASTGTARRLPSALLSSASEAANRREPRERKPATLGRGPALLTEWGGTGGPGCAASEPWADGTGQLAVARHSCRHTQRHHTAGRLSCPRTCTQLGLGKSFLWRGSDTAHKMAVGSTGAVRTHCLLARRRPSQAPLARARPVLSAAAHPLLTEDPCTRECVPDSRSESRDTPVRHTPQHLTGSSARKSTMADLRAPGPWPPTCAGAVGTATWVTALGPSKQTCRAGPGGPRSRGLKVTASPALVDKAAPSPRGPHWRVQHWGRGLVADGLWLISTAQAVAQGPATHATPVHVF